jgi:pSer/pThr/pTyr-binding forkhead associated (FHA) protein
MKVTSKNHQLTLIKGGEKIAAIALQGNYIIGRSKFRCSELAIAFDESPTLIIFNGAKCLSAMHCVLYQDSIGYQLIDGWGLKYSTNGVFCNGHKVDNTAIKHGDEITLGSDEISLLYESEQDAQTEEETFSNFKKV